MSRERSITNGAPASFEFATIRSACFRAWRSEPQIPQARVRTSTSPCWGSGSGKESTTTSLLSRMATARMGNLLPRPRFSVDFVIHRDTVAHMDSGNDRERRRRHRKERVLHTRVSDELDEALQDAARRLRVPVSNLVRNVLEDVFDVVEAVTENMGELVEDVVEEAQDFGRRFEHRWRRRAEAARERVV